METLNTQLAPFSLPLQNAKKRLTVKAVDRDEDH